MKKKRNKRILWVDDDISIISPHKRFLEMHGYIVDVARTLSQGLRLIEDNKYAIVILDVMIPISSEKELKLFSNSMTRDPHKSGLYFFQKITRESNYPAARIIVCTIRNDKEIQQEFISAGLSGSNFIHKISVSRVWDFLALIHKHTEDII